MFFIVLFPRLAGSSLPYGLFLELGLSPGIYRSLKPGSVHEASHVSLISDSEKMKEKERHFQGEAAHSIDLETGEWMNGARREPEPMEE